MCFNQAKQGCKQVSQINSVSLNSFQALAKRMKQGNPLYKLRLWLDAEINSAKPLWGKQGFTLIELLVVVLIIGILAAVAVPQYRLAVDKTRLLRLLPLARSVKEAQELFYLTNGRYAKNFDELDTDVLPFPMTISDGLAYGKNLRISLYGGTQYLGVGPFSPDFLWIWNYDHGPDKGRLDCYSYDSYAAELRKRICTYDDRSKHWVYKP